MAYNVGAADYDTNNAFMTGIPAIPWTFLFDSARTLIYAGAPARACKIVAQLAANEITPEQVKDLPPDTDTDFTYDPADEYTPEKSAAQEVAIAAVAAKGATVTDKEDYYVVRVQIETGDELWICFEDIIDIGAYVGGFDDHRVARAKVVAGRHPHLSFNAISDRPRDTDQWCMLRIQLAFDAFNQAHAEQAIDAISNVLSA